jgi:hypothetical protein
LLAILFEQPADAALGVPQGGLSILQAYAREDKAEPAPMTNVSPAGAAKATPQSGNRMPPKAYVTHAGTRLANAVVQHAIDSLDKFRKKLSENRNHVLRYPNFVLGGVASAGLSQEKGFANAGDFARSPSLTPRIKAGTSSRYLCLLWATRSAPWG